MTAQIADVVERLGRATGSDRELDAAIALAVGLQVAIHHGRVVAEDSSGQIIVPRYSESIDAAMTLVPNGWSFGLENGGRFDHNPNTEAWCWPFNSSFEPEWQSGDQGYRNAPEVCRGVGTAAIALCIAALKARSALSAAQGEARTVSDNEGGR